LGLSYLQEAFGLGGKMAKGGMSRNFNPLQGLARSMSGRRPAQSSSRSSAARSVLNQQQGNRFPTEAKAGLGVRAERGRLLDRVYGDLADPNYASRYMSEAAARSLGGFGSSPRSGAQIGAMGDVGMRAQELAGQRAMQALELGAAREAFATELPATALDSVDVLRGIITNNRDASGRLTDIGRREMETELQRLELLVGPERAQQIRNQMMAEGNQRGPGWLARLFGARG
jgi:hypothetical protein